MDCRPYYLCGSASDGCGPLFAFFVRLDRHFGHHTNAGRGDVRHGTNTPSVRLQTGLTASERHSRRRTGAVSYHALTGWLLCKLLSLPEELALGVILVGCCPGGTASNVICYLAKGDVALSVAMTGVSTLLAPIMTPALVWLLAGESVEVDVAGMFLSIVQVVIVPIVLGVAANHYFQRTTRRIVPLLPMISTLSIAFIIGIIVAHNATSILTCSLIVAVAVILHNVFGLVLGYGLSAITGSEPSKRSAIAIEVGMQNSGLATSLAATHFTFFPMAAVPGAMFSVWHNFSGSIAAQIFRRQSENQHNVIL